MISYACSSTSFALHKNHDSAIKQTLNTYRRCVSWNMNSVFVHSTMQMGTGIMSKFVVVNRTFYTPLSTVDNRWMCRAEHGKEGAAVQVNK